MQYDQQTDFGSEIEYAIESRVLKACDFAGDFRRHELFVNGELADARKHTRKSLQHSADMIHGIHVRGVEAGNHGIKTGLLFRRQGLIGHRNPRVRERVVVQRSVGVQVIRRRTISVNWVRPLLLQGDAEQSHAASFVFHRLQEIMNIRTLLNIVGQVKMGIVEFVIVRLRARGRNAHQ